jgi:hypothetical protein
METRRDRRFPPSQSPCKINPGICPSLRRGGGIQHVRDIPCPETAIKMLMWTFHLVMERDEIT